MSIFAELDQHLRAVRVRHPDLLGDVRYVKSGDRVCRELESAWCECEFPWSRVDQESESFGWRLETDAAAVVVLYDPCADIGRDIRFEIELSNATDVQDAGHLRDLLRINWRYSRLSYAPFFVVDPCCERDIAQLVAHAPADIAGDPAAVGLMLLYMLDVLGEAPARPHSVSAEVASEGDQPPEDGHGVADREQAGRWDAAALDSLLARAREEHQELLAAEVPSTADATAELLEASLRDQRVPFVRIDPDDDAHLRYMLYTDAGSISAEVNGRSRESCSWDRF